MNRLPIFKLPEPAGSAAQHINLAPAVTFAAVEARPGRPLNDRRA